MLKVVISGTCHGDIIQKLLEKSPEYRARARTTFVPNYQTSGGCFGPAPVEHLLPELAGCDLLIYHKVQAYDFPSLLRRLPASSLAVEIPYITSKLYWPTYDLEPIWLVKHNATAYIPFPCLALNRLVEQCPDDAVVRRTYLRMDLTKAVDMRAVVDGQMAYLRRIQQGTIFDFAGFTEANFRTRQLFHLINHPSIGYFEMMANRILQELGVSDSVELRPDPFGVQQMPVHPSVIAYHGLTWCDADTRWTIFDKLLSFEEHVDLYIHAYRERLRGG